MGQLSSKLRNAEDGGLTFRCPACDQAHQVKTGPGHGPRWGWNGDAERPTFTPSVVVRSIRQDLSDEEWTQYDIDVAAPGGTEAVLNDPRYRSVCHSFVTDGRIQYLGDCTHALAGQTVDLPDWPQPAEASA